MHDGRLFNNNKHVPASVFSGLTVANYYLKIIYLN